MAVMCIASLRTNSLKREAFLPTSQRSRDLGFNGSNWLPALRECLDVG
jgi:hypothetical protein